MTQKMEGKQLRRLSPSEEWECGGGWRRRRWGGEGDRRPLGASSRGPTSWLINPIKSPESIGAPGRGGKGGCVLSLPFPRTVCNNRKCNDSCPPPPPTSLPPSAFGSSSHLYLAGWQGGTRRDGTGRDVRRGGIIGQGEDRAGEWRGEVHGGILMGVFIL